MCNAHNQDSLILVTFFCYHIIVYAAKLFPTFYLHTFLNTLFNKFFTISLFHLNIIFSFFVYSFFNLSLFFIYSFLTAIFFKSHNDNIFKYSINHISQQSFYSILFKYHFFKWSCLTTIIYSERLYIFNINKIDDTLILNNIFEIN